MNQLNENKLSPKQAASEIGCSVRFILAEVRRRRIRPVYRFNKRVIVIPQGALDSYRAARMS